MLKLKLQYSGHLMWRVNSLEKTWMLERLKAGGEDDDKWWDGWMASPTQWSLSKLWEIVKNRKVVSMLQSTGLQSQTWLSDWTTTLYMTLVYISYFMFFADDLTIEVYFIFILNYRNDDRQKANSSDIFYLSDFFIQVHKAAKITRNINNAFGPGIANKQTVQWWFNKFCKGEESIVAGNWRLTTTNWDQSSKPIPSQLCAKLLKNSTSSIL